jgi:formylmethanofuran dehydrogenase subunit D
MEQKLEYLNEGRGGYVVYKDGQGDIKLFFEYGGGNCVAIIYVPTIAEWSNKAIKDQAPQSYYEISDTCIEIFNKETN